MTSTIPPETVVEPHAGSDGYIRGNHWAIPYHSNHTHENRDNLNLLQHVNCTYLSTPGRPPTLLALKQHAQSLAVLISMIDPSREAGEINNANVSGTTRTFTQNDAFDWLNDLLTHYNSVDQDHHRPLNSLANLIRQNNDIEGVEYHCPLDAIPLQHAEQNPEAQFRPFESHLTLLMHANECLERLDHEYSALGGLMSILPTDNDTTTESEALASARETLVGQWLLFTQHLTSRMHEMEIAYGNCLDLLANEAVVPAQHNSMHGPDGRAGREIVFPQDRWILANAGEDVFGFIHQMLDKKEAAIERVDREHDDRGVVGGALYTAERTRGIVALDFSTRFYRIKGSGHGPLFVLPAFGDRPSTKYTRDMEARPTVVTVPTPGMPGRTSAWDAQNRDKDNERRNQFTEIARLRDEVRTLHDGLGRQTAEAVRQRAINKVFTDAETNGVGIATQIQTLTAQRDTAQKAANDLTAQVDDLQKQVATYQQERANFFAQFGAQLPTQPPTVEKGNP